jgi:photosystem II stability/assembly factor-like uncharacterized protein
MTSHDAARKLMIWLACLTLIGTGLVLAASGLQCGTNPWAPVNHVAVPSLRGEFREVQATSRLTSYRKVRAQITATTTFRAVSCPKVDLCVAAGTSSPTEYAGKMAPLVEGDRDGRWSMVRVPAVGAWSGFFGISCGAPGSCVAVGYSGSYAKARTLIETTDGRTWSLSASPNPGSSVQLWGVSCAGRSFCAAVGTNNETLQPLIEVRTGRSWHAIRGPTAPARSQLAAVSCASPEFCVAVGTTPDATLTEAYNGMSWTILPSLSEPNTNYSQLAAVSCPKVNACVAVGSSYGSKNAGNTWRAETLLGGVWSLRAAPAPAAGSEMHDLSCVSISHCVAVGVSFAGSDGTNLAATLEGTSWTLNLTADNPSASQPGLASVSCPSPDQCVAVGSHFGGSAHYVTSALLLAHGRWTVMHARNIA